jgi:hypothetical protein
VWRARKNRIKKLRDDRGVWQDDPKVMGKLATDYFHNLLEVDQSLDPTPLVNLFEEKVSPEMNAKLCDEFSEKEISDALFQIGPLKAPGPDGFPARFFQRNWGTLKEEIILAVKEFFKTRFMPLGINDTTLVLIPKVDEPKGMSQFWPISLCNMVYKIISKCLVNRQRPFLGDIISREQSAFILGRSITAN